jgi:hypothetical protein
MMDFFELSQMYGTSGTPINKTIMLLELQTEVSWLNASLANLQERLDIAEEKLNEIKMIRYCEPDEFVGQGNGSWNFADVASFTWTPENQTDNAILSVCCYAEWKCNAGGAYGYLRVMVDNDSRDKDTSGVAFSSNEPINYTWTPPLTWNYGTVLRSSHTILVQVSPSSGTMFVRNINAILTVMDGLPLS